MQTNPGTSSLRSKTHCVAVKGGTCLSPRRSRLFTAEPGLPIRALGEEGTVFTLRGTGQTDLCGEIKQSIVMLSGLSPSLRKQGLRLLPGPIDTPHVGTSYLPLRESTEEAQDVCVDDRDSLTEREALDSPRRVGTNVWYIEQRFLLPGDNPIVLLQNLFSCGTESAGPLVTEAELFDALKNVMIAGLKQSLRRSKTRHKIIPQPLHLDGLRLAKKHLRDQHLERSGIPQPPRKCPFVFFKPGYEKTIIDDLLDA